MNESTLSAIERACARLVHDYARAADFGDSAAAAALFAEDGVLEMPGGRRFAGRDAIRKRLEEQPAAQVSRHVISNLIVDAVDESRARGFCYLTLYRGTRSAAGGPLPSAAPFVIGHYEDEFVRDGGDWRFAARRLTFTFRRGDG
jgi:ketosteroid isomerase-like protein